MQRMMFLVALVLLLTATSPAAEPKKSGTVTKVEFVTCASASTIKSEKSVCYVIDTATREKKLVVQLCAGVNVNVGTVILGGGVKSLMCATVEFPQGTKEDDAIRAAESALAEKLKSDRQILKDLEKKLGLTETPKEWATFRVKKDEEMAKKLKKALGEAKSTPLP